MNASDLYRLLTKFTDDLIREKKEILADGYNLSVSNLSESDLEDFVSRFIQYDTAQGEPWLWLSEADDRDTVSSLFTQYLNTYSPDKKFDFMESLVQQSIETYKPKIGALLSERLLIVEQEDLIESGMRSLICNQTGETLWT